MRIAQINLPILDNNGVTLAHVHAALKRDLLAAFGGLTSWDAQGSWIDDGKVYDEPVTIYQVAHRPSDALQEHIRKLARKHGADAGQIAMFIVLDGEAEIITI